MRYVAAALIVATLAAGVQPAMAANSQQDRMKTCNADAGTKQLKGDARRNFMKQCLSGSATAH
jgi:hypothetical protein